MKTNHLFTPAVLVCSLLYGAQVKSQNIINDTIPVGTGSLVELVFASQPNGIMPEGDGSYEVGGGNRKSLTVKALRNGAKDQPLRVTEGGRTHEFVLVFDEKAAPQRIDRSNMKELKRYVKGKKDKADKTLAETNQLYERGDHEVALERYRRLYYDMEEPDRSFIKTKIGDLESRLLVRNQLKFEEEIAKGTQLALQKKLKEAIAAFESALKYNPSDTAAKNRLEKSKGLYFRDRIRVAQKAYEDRNYILAKEAYEEARDINPSEFSQHYLAGYNRTLPKVKDQEYQQYKKKGDQALSVRNLKEAKEAYDAALQILPNDPYCKGRLKEWTRLQDAAVEKEKKEIEYYTLLFQAKRQADLATTARDYDLAIEAYQKASKIFASRQFPKDRILELGRMKRSVAIGRR